MFKVYWAIVISEDGTPCPSARFYRSEEEAKADLGRLYGGLIEAYPVQFTPKKDPPPLPKIGRGVRK